MEQCDDDTSAGCANRVSERNGTAIDIDAFEIE